MIASRPLYDVLQWSCMKSWHHALREIAMYTPGMILFRNDPQVHLALGITFFIPGASTTDYRPLIKQNCKSTRSDGKVPWWNYSLHNLQSPVGLSQTENSVTSNITQNGLVDRVFRAYDRGLPIQYIKAHQKASVCRSGG